jgi:hypothetical protein
MTYSHKGNDPAAHSAAVVNYHLRTRYGTSDPARAWAIAVDQQMATGLTALAARAAVMEADPELADAYRALRLSTPAAAPRPKIDRATATKQWHALADAKVATGLSRYQALVKVLEERPDLYQAIQ